MIAIIKYNAGNIKSVQNALQRLNCDSVVTDDITLLRAADKVIFPGVGEAYSAMKYLRERGLDEVIVNLTQPVLGICLGLQLMCAHSEERDTHCLGIFDHQVVKFQGEGLIPHMGWNEITDLQGPLLDQVHENSDVYFVHSFYAEVGKYTVGKCQYINTFSACLQKNNFYATQFHPEKSAEVGQIILQNFLEI